LWKSSSRSNSLPLSDATTERNRVLYMSDKIAHEYPVLHFTAGTGTIFKHQLYLCMFPSCTIWEIQGILLRPTVISSGNRVFNFRRWENQQFSYIFLIQEEHFVNAPVLCNMQLAETRWKGRSGGRAGGWYTVYK
jgi:hypothetical protein